jgi:hypothetical protein
LLRGQRWCGSGGNDDVDLPPDEIGRKLGETLAISLAPTVFNSYTAAFNPSKLLQPLLEYGSPGLPTRRLVPF